MTREEKIEVIRAAIKRLQEGLKYPTDVEVDTCIEDSLSILKKAIRETLDGVEV